MSVLIWMGYAALVGALLTLAALALETALLRRGWPARGAWAAAILLSGYVPLLPALPGRGDSAAAETGTVAVAIGEPVAAMMAAAPAALPPWLGDTLLGGWLAASLLLSLVGVWMWARLRLAARHWSDATVDGIAVRVAPSMGPAVVGFLRRRIVLPRWALTLEPEARRLMLAHEAEHMRARDPLLLLGALIACVAMPWNPALWWQLRRLREAIELDCDRRVLTREDVGAPSLARYGELLLFAGRRGSAPTWSAAMAEPARMLERRIRTMTRRADRRLTVSLAAAAAAAVLVVAACEIPQPVVPTSPSPQQPAVSPVAAQDTLDPRPTFTPYEVSPQLLNRDEYASALIDAYPADFRDAGVGGTAVLWLHIGASGRVLHTAIVSSSGHPRLDDAAQQVVRNVARFEPARNLGQAVPVWIQMPVTFRVGGVATATSAPALSPAAAAAALRRAERSVRLAQGP